MPGTLKAKGSVPAEVSQGKSCNLLHLPGQAGQLASVLDKPG